MPRDYEHIDPDEGRDFPEPFYTYGEPCENCGQPCESRTWVPGFDYWGCDDCVSEARIVVFAEATCPTLYAAIMRARKVSDVQQAYREHRESCPNCNPQVVRLPEAA